MKLSLLLCSLALFCTQSSFALSTAGKLDSGVSSGREEVMKPKLEGGAPPVKPLINEQPIILVAQPPVAENPVAVAPPEPRPVIEINFFPNLEKYYTDNERSTVQIIRNQLELFKRVSKCKYEKQEVLGRGNSDLICPKTYEAMKLRLAEISSDFNTLNKGLPTVAALEQRRTPPAPAREPMPPGLARDIVIIKKPQERGPAAVEPLRQVPTSNQADSNRRKVGTSN